MESYNDAGAQDPDDSYTSTKGYHEADTESQALLPTVAAPSSHVSRPPSKASPSFLSKLLSHPRIQLSMAFLAGVLTCVFIQVLICSQHWFDAPSLRSNNYNAGSDDETVRAQADLDALALAPPWVGASEIHRFPPAQPTNVFPSLFPTHVDPAGPTPTGAEAALVATAPSYPIHTGAPHLVQPSFSKSSSSGGKPKAGQGNGNGNGNGKGKGGWKQFDLFRHWGNLSPWFSVERGAFGLDSSPDVPQTCRVTGLHLLHRHGARYPTQWASWGGPAMFAKRLNEAASKFNATGDLAFLNEWTYKMGEEILTPFGRQQMFDLGVSMRMKYGFLLQNYTETNTLPVFRTESQNRMWSSAMNFALGFFGYPLDGQYQESITVEANGFNNTLAPYMTCPNAHILSKSDRQTSYVKQWASIYLKDAHARLASQITGYDLTLEDAYTLQQMCAYETVSLGYSQFCGLFTQEEWEGFDYSMDVFFWYNSAFGAPLARVEGIGYIQELVARLTNTPIPVHNSSTNGTLDDNPVTFPLGQSLYVDATHEVVVLNVITALNLTSFAEQGPLPADHIPSKQTFKASHLAPFGTNIQFQLLSCANEPEQQIRVIVNDGVAPLTGIRGCPAQKDGMCPVPTFVAAQRENIAQTDWVWACHGDWEVPEGTAWNTTTGDPPAR